MIPCTDFIPAYSELFNFIEENDGHDAVVDFWNYISDNVLTDLRNLARKHGLRGCWMYWQRTLDEEAADFTLELDEELGEFRIIMHRCPSKGRLLEYTHVQPYSRYCQHCDVLYRRVLEPLGFEFIYDFSGCDDARCSVTIRNGSSPAAPQKAETDA